MPAATSTRVTRPGTLHRPCAVGGTPVTGPRKFSKRCPTIRNAPAPTEPTASRIIGHVIVAGGPPPTPPGAPRGAVAGRRNSLRLFGRIRRPAPLPEPGHQHHARHVEPG